MSTPIRAACAGLALAISCAIFALSHGSSAQESAAKPVSINIFSNQIGFDRDKPDRTRFGKLEWLGTLRLESEAKPFGGYSGLVVDATGTKLLAVSDKGTWLRAEIVYRNGRMERLIKARVGPLRATTGKVLDKKFYQDAEGITLVHPGSFSGDAYISFERLHRIAVHKLTPDGIGPARRLLKLPAGVRSAKRNKGLEAVTVVRGGPSKGALLALTEEYLDDQDNHHGWLIGGPKPGRIGVKQLKGFGLTDAASLPNGDVILLERRFRYSEGVKMRLRRFKAANIKAGALLTGEVLFETNQLREIDNMEGLAVHQGSDGRPVLTLISDDNFNRLLQRTLLMQFRLHD